MREFFVYISFFILNFSLYSLYESKDIGDLGLQVNKYDDSAISEGNIYFTIGKKAIILSSNGENIVLEKNFDKVVCDFKKHSNGLLSLCIATKPKQWLIMNSEGTLIGSHYPIGNYEVDNHEFIIKDNGNYLYLAFSRDEKLHYNIIQEITLDNMIVFQWDTRAYFSKQRRSSELTHSNAIWIDKDDNYLVSQALCNEITKIDRKTGEIIWRLGGKNNQFQFINDPFQGFSILHNPSRLENGNILIFDNGLRGRIKHKYRNSENTRTRVVEYELDEEKMTATLIWEYHSDIDQFSIACGSCQRLQNGNTLICWGFMKKFIKDSNAQMAVITEVTPNKNKVFEITASTTHPDLTFIKEDVWGVYRAFKIE